MDNGGSKQANPVESKRSATISGSLEQKLSSKKSKLSRKERRLQQVHQEKRVKALRTWIPLGFLVVALTAVAIYRLNQPEVDDVLKVTSAPANQHDDTLVYPYDGVPPTGGPHAPVWQNCGIYRTPIAITNAIHSMEHGAVWITFDAALDATELSALENIAGGDPFILMSPYPDQGSSVVLTTWDRQLQLERVDDLRIKEFIDRYQQRAPETAPCSGGIGTPDA